MNTVIGMIGLLVAIGFLVYMAFKGHSIIVVAPIAAMAAILFSYGVKGHFMASYTITYMDGFLIEMWADNTAYQSMEQATEKIANAYQFVTGKMKEAGMEVL